VYRRLLVANRGEIAVRIIRACHELGITAVAVYSEPDADALHVRLADEAYLIGPAPVRESYLNIARIVEAAAQARVEAVHPGYGLLSENPHFAAVCHSWGLDFVGPEPEAIEAMGLKTAARRRVQEAGVPVVPGTDAALGDPEAALRAADAIGYPLLIKAASGGGGRGIRVASNPDELRAAFEAAEREALASFVGGDLYMERLLEQARHVEVQILADRHGHVVHLLERESSTQRRRQKLIEEAPSPVLDEGLRARMAAAAVAAARAVDYTGAGTVEFLLDRDRNFYFLEMNTRLQVEHPVTEAITGVDVVQEQIRVAAGQPLSFEQADVHPNGWAVECRVNAEDPDNRFLPSPGTITIWDPPRGPWVRVDDGVHAGFEVQPFYDSLLAKVITWGRNRQEALGRMARALDEFRVEGIKTTIPLHRRLIQDPDFQAGRYHTTWVEERLSRETAAAVR
jgi:acetyl-CoA carboxylase biotin carboxylase subunit